MVRLNSNEYMWYMKNIVHQIPVKPAGLYYVRDFFGTLPTSPRIARRLFEEVSLGRISGITLVGKRSQEGHLIHGNAGRGGGKSE